MIFLSVGGKGGFPWEHVYRMPVRVRKLCVNKLKEILEKESETINRDTNTPSNNSKVHKPGIIPKGNTASIPKVQKSSAGLRKR